jgi:hypothetical protein
MKCVTWEAFMLRNLITSKSYLMVHFKEPDDFFHVVAVETLQWSITFPFFYESIRKGTSFKETSESRLYTDLKISKKP